MFAWFFRNILNAAPFLAIRFKMFVVASKTGAAFAAPVLLVGAVKLRRAFARQRRVNAWFAFAARRSGSSLTGEGARIFKPQA